MAGERVKGEKCGQEMYLAVKYYPKPKEKELFLPILLFKTPSVKCSLCIIVTYILGLGSFMLLHSFTGVFNLH